MKILIPVNVYQKLRGYAQATNYEISGLGKLTLLGDNILVEEIRIFEQEVGYANTKLDHRALAKFYDELMQADEDPSQWRMWWHSHAKMETFWSATDVATIEDFDTEMDANNWVLALETNREDEIITRIDIFKPLRVTVPDIPWEIYFENKRIEDDAFSEAMLKIKTPPVTKNLLNRIVDGKKNRIEIKLNRDDDNPLFPTDKTTIIERGD